jgi:allophanate hydrolase subunit 2
MLPLLNIPLNDHSFSLKRKFLALPKTGKLPSYGPHGAPDFFTKQDIDTFFANEFEIHYNSSRTGIRLIGPKPEWAREDGGEAGYIHPIFTTMLMRLAQLILLAICQLFWVQMVQA